MSNLTINRIGPEAQSDSAWHDEDIEASRFSGLDVRPQPARWRGRDLLGAVLAVLAGWLTLLLVFWLAARLTEARYPPPLGWLLFWQFLLAATAAAPIVGAALWAVAWWREHQAYVTRARLARDRLMNPVPADLLARMTPHDYVRILGLMAALERDTAPYRAYRGVESLSLSAGQSRPAPASEPLALPASVPVDPPSAWIDDLLATEAHIMLAGRSGSGKTATAEALLARAIDRGDAVMVIDPHAEPNKWHGVPAIGAGRDYTTIKHIIKALEAEMTARYLARARGDLADEPAMVIVDEVPAIAGALGSDWKAFSTRLGSEARKIGIRLLLITQSPLVEDIGLNSVMRRNFAIIGLDLASIRLMLRDEPDSVIKRALLDALEGERYPAVREVAGQFRICDRRGLDRIRPTRTPRVWRLPVCDADASGPAQTDRRADDETIERLKTLIRAGITRDEARAQGVAFDNSDWTRARREVEAESELLNGLLVASQGNGLRATTEVQG